MLAFEAQTPQDILHEVAEYLRQLAAHNARYTGRTQKSKALADARASALECAAVDLDHAGIVSPDALARLASRREAEPSTTPLQFAEFIAHHRSANLHGFHSDIVQMARKVAKENGGRLDAIGRYKAGEVMPMSWEEYAKVKAIRRREQEAGK